MKVKVLAFADFPSPYRVEVFKGLAKKYEIFAVFDKMSDQNRNAEWFCKDTGLNSISLLEEAGRVQFEKEVKEIKKYDLVLAYDYHIRNAIKLELACIRNKVPYIMNLDGAFIRKNFLKNLIKRYLVTHASGYFASGSHAAEYFKYFGADESKIYYHPFTSLHEEEILKIPVSKEEKNIYKRNLGLSSKKMVLTIGQFIYRKGFDILLGAWSKELDEKYTLVIVGGGEEENQYREYISKHNLKNVHLVGFKQKNEIFEYYKAADLFVLPTREDIWGLVINEAMAFGLPVIATDMCLGAVELIENGVNCIILTTYNNPSIARKILCTKGCKDVTFFNISYDCMYEWYVEQLEVPYYFVLHPNKKASDFFLPEKSKPDITDSYIKSIARICSVNGVSINNKYK